MTDPTRRERFLDAWRGLAVLVMLFWHFAWDLAEFGVFSKGVMFDPPMAGVRTRVSCTAGRFFTG